MVLAGCSPAGTGQTGADNGPVMGGDLVIARGPDALTMDSTSAQFENFSMSVFQQMGQSLFEPTPDGQDLAPLLATGFTVSDDGLTYTIPLREDIVFSDGSPMTANDVKFSIDQDTKTANTGWGFVNSAIDVVNIVDDYTIDVVLKYPWAPIIADLSMFSNAIVPDNYGGKTAEAYYTAPVLTGPFMWGEWKKGQYLKLVKNPNYWKEGKPYLDSVSWNVVPDSNTRKLQLQGGQVDINDTPDWSSFDSLDGSPSVTTYAFPSTQIDYVGLNQAREPFSDVHVRRAIAFAVDRQALVDAVLFGHGEVANSLLSPGTPFYDENVEGPQYDVAKAKAELAMSSKPDGFSTTLLIRSGNANQATSSQIIQDQLKVIGIDVEIVQLDPTANKKALQAMEYDMAFSVWTMDIPDPDQWTTFALTPEGGAHSAFTNYENPELIALNEKAQRSNDPAERENLYSQIQETAGEEAFLTYLYYSPYAFASTDKVKGFAVTPLGNYRTEDIYKIK
jgi:peptide/nickel transport system substrate-binding protein